MSIMLMCGSTEGWSEPGSRGERTREKEFKFPGCQIMGQKNTWETRERVKGVSKVYSADPCGAVFGLIWC